MRGQVDREQLGSMDPGQDLVVAGYPGEKGARLAAQLRRSELSQWFSEDYLEQVVSFQDVVLDGSLEYWKELGATEREPVGEGGIWTALWNLSGAYEVGIQFTLQQVPVRQMTIEICERYDLNPYRLLSENCMVLVADNGLHLVNTLKERGIPAKVIGQVTPGIKREVYNGATRGFMERPGKDEICKIP